MFKKPKASKQNLNPTSKTASTHAKSQQKLHKTPLVPYHQALLKTTFSTNNERKSSVENTQKSFLNVQDCNGPQRFFTQTVPNYSRKTHHNHLNQSQLKENKTKDLFRKKSGEKERLSLSTAIAKPKSKEVKPRKSSKKELNWNEIEYNKVQIQAQVRKIALKPHIQKKQLLKISKNYEKLIDRIKKQWKSTLLKTMTREEQNWHSQPLTVHQLEVNETVQFPEGKLKLGDNRLGLQLSGLKKKGIPDYADEFMSHYDQLSESWKRDIEVQRRY